MDINFLFPFGTDGQFPDNGLIPQSYDVRVTQNDMRKVSSGLMRQGDAYYREEKTDGTGKYSWNIEFINGINSTFATGVIANFSKVQRKLFDKYMAFASDSLSTVPSEAVVQLDLYLGSR